MLHIRVFKGWFGDFKASFSFLEGFGLINTGLVKMRLRA